MENHIIIGDCLDVLRTLPDASVQTCITSPPYWGLRDYGTATWEGGSGDCDHVEDYNLKRDASGGLGGGRDKGTRGEQGYSSSSVICYRDTCAKCGAVRIDNQLGLEPTPEEYVSKLVAVFREVRRVLADDGTLWLNLGDSYAGSSMSGGAKSSSTLDGAHHEERKGARFAGVSRDTPGLKPKDLVGIPWRVAFALQADGWWLRQDIIWHKPNPMPESVTDRCTKAHEYIFLLSKSARYYYDNEAIAEEGTGRSSGKHTPDKTGAGTGFEIRGGFAKIGDVEWYTRNRRSVWTVSTKPFSEAHFATFPPALIEPCVLSGSREGDTVLDPFSGAGTTGLVALAKGRRYIGIELNPEYAEMARRRIQGDAPMFNQVAIAA